MLKTYTNSDGNKISFILYAFFPSEQLGEKTVSKNEINEMLNTKNIEYICDYIAHIKKIENPEIKNLVSKERKTKEEKEKIRQYFITNELEVLCDIDDFLNETVINPPAELGRLTDARGGEQSIKIENSAV